ncbi:MAG: C25 family cysteine peptidase [Bacteroidia bacterium]
MIQLKNTMILLPLLLGMLLSWGQAPQGFYGNEWYQSDPSRTFIPLKVWEDGVYRLGQADLLAAGYDLSSVNPDYLQLYYRGAEQRVYVQKSNNQLDYLEFVGFRNDGQVDALMYRHPVTGIPDPSIQPQPRISLYSDTAVYFLTWSNQLGLRTVDFFETNYSAYNPEPSFPFEQIVEYHPDSAESQYVVGGGGQFDSFYTLNSDYVTGEGYVGRGFGFGDPLQLQIPLIAADTHLQTIEYRTRIFGRSNSPHHYRISDADTILWDTVMSWSQVVMREFCYGRTQVLPSVLDLTFEAWRSPVENNNLCGLSLVYDRLPSLIGESSVLISRWDQNATVRFDLEQVDGNDTLYAWDQTLGIRSKGLINNGQAQILVPLRDSSQNVRLVSDLGVRVPQIESHTSLSNLCDPDSGAQFVIISHRSLATSANAYALYRDTSTVEPLSAKVVYVDEIYEEFGYGSMTPLAIKRFVNCALATWNVVPEYILLWGKAGYDLRGQPWALVPTYGYPETDHEFVRPLAETTTFTLPLAIGRLGIRSNFDGMAYLMKVDTFEHTPWAEWQQRAVMHGGTSLGIRANDLGAYFAQLHMRSPFHGFPLGYHLEIPSNSLPPQYWIANQWFNEGVGLICGLGSYTTNTSPLGWYEKESLEFDNWGRPLTFFGYLVPDGAGISSPFTSRGQRFLYLPSRGGIAFLNIHPASYLNPARDFAKIHFATLFGQNPNARIGDVNRQAIMTIVDSLPGIQYRNHARQFLLQGDPALRLFSASNTPIDPVYPGDTDNDGIADMGDLLQLGLAYGDSGYSRLGATNLWTPQASLPWDSAFSAGVNHKYADSDGNGKLNALDTLAISLNFGSIHQKKEDDNFVESGVPLTLLIPQVINPGDTAVIQVFVGDSINPTSIYGLRFNVGYDTSIVAPGQLWVDFSDSWLGNEGAEMLGMYKDQRADGEIAVGLTRLNQQALIGGGKAADINIVITDDIAKQEWSLRSLSFTQGFAQDETGDEIPLNALAAWNNELPAFEALYVRIFPNPVVDQICIERSTHDLKDFVLWDLQARQVVRWSDEEVALGCLPIADLRSGFYLLTYEEDGLSRTQKIMVID